MLFLQAAMTFFSVISLIAAAPVPIRRSSSTSASVAFAADSSINVTGIYAAAKAAHSKSLAPSPYAAEPGAPVDVHIYGDWLNLTDKTSAFYFIADMDIDCDGKDYKCKGNTDGQAETSFGKLDASQVPFIVIPETFTDQHKSILKPNALSVVICDNKMYYGIYGDQNGDTPEVIGEASLLMGQTCFGDSINGNNGHGPKDVAYIVFGLEVPDGVGKTTIDIDALKTLGDQQVKLLQDALNLGTTTTTRESNTATETTTTTGKSSTATET